jgi:succinate dehydrogenase / fumarate reductase, iron-sulfur subunit
MTATMDRPLGSESDKPKHHGKTLDLTLRVWRQDGPNAAGRFETYEAKGISDDASFLEMLDIVNERLNDQSKEPITFDHDCREGICGTCSLVIDGIPHGPEKGTATCQLHMRKFRTGQTVTIEPWRATAFPIVKDLMVDRAAFDRIVEAGGYITVAAGSAPDANLIPIPKPVADAAMDAAACIGCGACVAACPNGAASLFTAAKVAHLNLLPQGQSQRYSRVESMVEKMEEYFGSCTNHGECQEACPKSISIDFIALMNKDYLRSKLKNRRYLSRKP